MILRLYYGFNNFGYKRVCILYSLQSLYERKSTQHLTITLVDSELIHNVCY